MREGGIDRGKTHLAIELGVMTAELGHRVYFTTAIDLVRKLSRAMHENRLSREIKNLTRPKLLIIDEVGYLQLERPEASLLFQVISQRYASPGCSHTIRHLPLGAKSSPKMR